jgi:hypothetical protein
MDITDYLAIGSIVAGCSTVLGWWLKSRLDSSIKHEYDKLIEIYKSELKRSDVLLTERIAAYKVMSPLLIALRRYCDAQSAEYRNQSEFEPRTESLSEQESISLLSHHHLISRELDNIELFVSPSARNSFHELFSQMGLGFNLELWLSSKKPDKELLSSADVLYDSISTRVNGVLAELYKDMSLPNSLTTQ